MPESGQMGELADDGLGDEFQNDAEPSSNETSELTGAHHTNEDPPTGLISQRVLATVEDVLRQQGVPEAGRVIQAFQSFQASMSYSGPLPPAEQAAAWDAVVPGAADRILKMAEKQQEHRHELEKTTIGGRPAVRTRGSGWASSLAWWSLV